MDLNSENRWCGRCKKLLPNVYPCDVCDNALRWVFIFGPVFMIAAVAAGIVMEGCIRRSVPEQPRTVTVRVTDGDKPILGAFVLLDANDPTGIHKAGSDVEGVATLPLVPPLWLNAQLTVTATGCQPYGHSVVIPKGNAPLPDVVLSCAPTWPDPVAQPPLHLEPDSDGYVCHQSLPPGLVIPNGADRRFWRGDAWGVTVPGLPFVAGGSSRHPERALSWFQDRYPLDAQADILRAHRRRGLTHFTLSWPDSRDYGQSAEQFAATAVRVHQAMPFVHAMLTSKYYDPANADAVTRMAAVSPAIDALIAAGFDGQSLILAVGWELDLFNEGQKLEDFIHALHAKYGQFDLYVHFTSYKTSWQPDGQPRAQFWAATRGELTGLLYQANPSDGCGLMQAHFNDALIPASGIAAAGGIVVPWELVASAEFDGDHPNEDDANARGWEVLATPGPFYGSGGGNGLRYPDGTPILSRYPR